MSARPAPQLETLPGMELGDATSAPGEGPALTAEQEQAVQRRSEPLLVSAAAGSGKTSVLVERFVRAVREDAVAPGRILAITFTERAAGELRERVRARLLELGERRAARDAESAFVGTIHGFCARLLRAHPLAVKLDPGFVVLDEGLAGRLRARAFQDAAREFVADDPDQAADLLAAYGVDRVGAMLETVYLELRSRGERWPRLPQPRLVGEDAEEEREAVAVCVLLDELLGRFAGAYERRKRGDSVVDFDDLELLAQELLLGNDAVRDAWAGSFELLMVDEFQDTNPRQLAILGALDRENLFTVGDELQSIYGFRHADVSLFRARHEALARGGGSVALSRNFRSRPEVLEVINPVFGERFAGFEPLIAGRDDAREPERTVADPAARMPAVELLLTDAAGWEEQESLREQIEGALPFAQAWRRAEARLLSGRIAELVEEGGARPGEIAVLLRATGDLEVFERALQLRGLRTLAAVGAFWGHQQIRDLVTYLRALANPLDEQAFYGVLASPLGGCSRDCLALLALAAREQRTAVWEAARSVATGSGELASRLQPGDREALVAVVELLTLERRAAPRHPIAVLLQRAIDARSYREHVLALDWGERRLANVHKLLRLAREFEAREGRELRAFLDHVEYLQDVARIEPDAPVSGAAPEAVRLMTVHAAKGLEFPVVCLADLGRQPNARVPDLLVDGSRIGVRLMRLDGGASCPALAYEELCAERKQREAEEEDRILYVAMTRARERLILSGAASFARWPRTGPGAAPISWLAPTICARLPELLASSEPQPRELALGPDGAGRVRLLLNSPRAGAPVGGVAQARHPDTARRATVEPRRSNAGARDDRLPDGPTRPGGVRRARAERPAGEPGKELSRVSTFSYSSLTELERCGYRYYLERVLGIGEDRSAARGAGAGTGEGLEARARGTLVHRLMELLNFADPRPPSAAAVGTCARELGLTISASEREELAALIASSCSSELVSRVAAASDVRREHPFAFSLAASEPLISGVIDLLASETDGTSLVLDYKSDRVSADADLEELVEREYGVQRLLYALAVLRDGAGAVEVVHWFLEPGAWTAVRFQAADRLLLEEQLSQRLARARERAFAVSEHPHRGLCLTCPGRAGLCSWGEAETLREHP